ncbi:MAG TPA: anti-sigma factor [Microvirga sp.]|nr:anti-sigma factor [Microvirga sp.]
MSTVGQRVMEDDLQAYVDGRLNPERAVLVESYLRANPRIALRIKSYCRTRQELKDLLAAKAREAIPRRLRIRSIMAGLRQARLDRYRLAAVVCLCLALGFLFGWAVGGMSASGMGFPGAAAQADTLRRDALTAHRFLATGTPADVFLTAEEAQLRRWLHRRLGAPFSIPSLSDFGLRFLGGQILPYRQDNAVALLSYGDDQGVRVTVYLRAGEHGNTVLRSVSLDDTVVFYWLDKRCGYVVAATTDRDRLSRIAKAVFNHFEVTQSVDKTVL